MNKGVLKAAFPNTLPVLAGYLFLGIAYGVYMNVSGFPFWYPLIISIVVFGGSLQFVMVALLLAPFAPLQTLIMAFVIQARHIFYGISMLEKYKDTGKKKLYLIFGLSDETFSVNYAARVPEGMDKGIFYFTVTILDQVYWIVGATIGGLIGSLFTFDTTGLDFVMTAMFVVIFLEQWLKEKQHYTALIGLAATVVCRLCFGPDQFLLPTLLVIFVCLTVGRKPISRKGELQ